MFEETVVVPIQRVVEHMSYEHHIRPYRVSARVRQKESEAVDWRDFFGKGSFIEFVNCQTLAGKVRKGLSNDVVEVTMNPRQENPFMRLEEFEGLRRGRIVV